MGTKQDKAAQNRAAFPQTAQFVDEMREAFGQDVKLVWAEENGRTLGKKGPDGVPVTQVFRPKEKNSRGMD